jgi:mannose-6-phosphate isomerase-like protein (cupin superfamily)
MRLFKALAFVAVGALSLFSTVRAQGQRESTVWAPVPVKPMPWVAPNKPIWKLSELLAKHKGQLNWKETVVSDELLHADYISMAPGVKTPRQFHPDTRTWWIVQDGQIRFTIEGQEPFIATKGFMVQVPYRNIFSLETVGDKPSLRLEVNIANAQTMYPLDETPTPKDGFEFVKVRISGKGNYDEGNKPFIDFSQVVAGVEKQQRFIADDRAVANIIRGNPKTQAPANTADKGHFHEESAEFWFVLEGQIEYRIGSLPIFVADQGDVVYVPRQTWHRARFAGTEMATRLAMNGYQDLLHDYQLREELAGR